MCVIWPRLPADLKNNKIYHFSLQRYLENDKEQQDLVLLVFDGHGAKLEQNSSVWNVSVSQSHSIANAATGTPRTARMVRTARADESEPKMAMATMYVNRNWLPLGIISARSGTDAGGGPDADGGPGTAQRTLHH
jgi:hypothetical protein